MNTFYVHRARTLNNKEMNLVWIRKYTLGLILFVMTGTREPTYRGNSDNSTKIDWPRNKARFHRFRCFSANGRKKKKEGERERDREKHDSFLGDQFDFVRQTEVKLSIWLVASESSCGRGR